jgi:hypothetical protein
MAEMQSMAEGVQSIPAALQALEALILQDDDFKKLESSLRPFNIFEALRIVNQELRHSDFLSYLCDPNANHGLGDAFTRRLLQEALLAQSERNSDVSPMDFDLWDLDDLEVRREWQNIDLLLMSRARQLVVIIENKVWSSEHSNQLERYWSAVAAHFPGYKRVGLYLSPDGSAPSVPDYVPVSYELLVAVVDWFTAAMPASDVQLLMGHYSQMVRRRILEDTELAVLCRQIYARHREALDLLFSFRFDTQEQIRAILTKLIQETPGLGEDRSSKGYIRFYATEWDNYQELLQGEGWTSTHRLLLFQFNNSPERLFLGLHIGPGPAEVRRRLLEMTLNDRTTFNYAYGTLNAKWNTVFQQEFLAASALTSSDSETLEQAIRPHWSRFVESQLPAILNSIRGHYAS